MKKKCFKYISLAALLIVIGCSNNDDITNEPNVSLSEAEELLILVNNSRLEEGLQIISLNTILNKTALAHSTDMNNNDYFSHKGQNGSTFSERVYNNGYTGYARGENIALGQKNANAVHNTWMNSELHKSNILSEQITEMGIGHDGKYWTQIFGVAK